MSTSHDTKIKEFHEKQEEANFSAMLNRARSVTVGTCFNGVTEIMMRGNDGKVLWCVMEQHEVVELVHQLAANVGCHIALKPRHDFGSWRQWGKEEEPLLAGTGMASSLNNPSHAKIAHENQPGLDMPVRSNENVMATEKTVNRRSTKRAAKTA